MSYKYPNDGAGEVAPRFIPVGLEDEHIGTSS